MRDIGQQQHAGARSGSVGTLERIAVASRLSGLRVAKCVPEQSSRGFSGTRLKARSPHVYRGEKKRSFASQCEGIHRGRFWEVREAEGSVREWAAKES